MDDEKEVMSPEEASISRMMKLGCTMYSMMTTMKHRANLPSGVVIWPKATVHTTVHHSLLTYGVVTFHTGDIFGYVTRSWGGRQEDYI